MAYNPSLYNPYGLQQPIQYQPQQSINGLSFIDKISDLDTLQMAPGSTSQPFFLKNENKFVVVSFDKTGASTKKMFSFDEIPMAMNNNSGDFVTREYFDQQMNNIMEAINGKFAISATTTEQNAATSEPSGNSKANQAPRAV